MNSQTPQYQHSSCLNEENNFSNATLKFISDILMEEDDSESMPYMLHDSLALLATQESFQAVLNDDQSAESSEMYDNVLLSSATNQLMTQTYNDANKKGVYITEEYVDLRSMLMTCAQAVANSDTMSATRLLLQIRPHSSPQGDSLQRVAHSFANALEARLNGTGNTLYASLNSKRRSASAVLKANKMCISTCPIRKMSMLLVNKTIEKLAAGATKLHIIDFGIMYGFQWPRLIQILSKRHSGPPKLRITGIEFPQKGESPEESLEETGRRLAKYCERFGVPFQYKAIAKNWETIRLEDLKIKKDELLVVNSLYRFHNLLDETVVANNPRDAVLNLIKNSNTAMFIHGVSNGQYSSPFFATRFKEALFHFYNIFDMLEATVLHEDENRLFFEEHVLGKTAMNVIACEGTERIERPESYKQWQIRMRRAGYRQIPLDQEIVKYVRCTVNTAYNKDFYVDEDRKWLLLGWKGRVNAAVSCWLPVNN